MAKTEFTNDLTSHFSSIGSHVFLPRDLQRIEQQDAKFEIVNSLKAQQLMLEQGAYLCDHLNVLIIRHAKPEAKERELQR